MCHKYVHTYIYILYDYYTEKQTNKNPIYVHVCMHSVQFAYHLLFMCASVGSTDYVLTTTMATLKAGQTEFTVVINITDDRRVEDNEGFTVELNLSDSLMDCGGRVGVNGSVTITIEDNDGESP